MKTSSLQLVLLLFFYNPLALASATDSHSEAPKPTMNISLSRQNIRENDCLPVEIWFFNEDGQEITEVNLHIATPYFFSWSTNPCKAKNDVNLSGNINLEPVSSIQSATSKSIRFRELYLKTGSDIEVGDYNLLFTSKFSWKIGGEVGQSIIASEKPIKVNFLGSESVAGLPLGLAGLIVPGLFFWIFIRFLGVPWSLETPLGDKLIYSIVVSFIFVALASGLIRFAPWLHYLDISSGISIHKLIWLACTGAGAGMIVSFLDYMCRKKRAKSAAEIDINFNDSPTVIFGKLLRKNKTYNPLFIKKFCSKSFAGYKPQTTVTLKNGTIYFGSLGEQGRDTTVLAGWFEVANGKNDTILKKLLNKGLIFEVFNSAHEKKLLINLSDSIKTITDGTPTSIYKSTMVWPNNKVSQFVLEPYKGQEEALVLGE